MRKQRGSQKMLFQDNCELVGERDPGTRVEQLNLPLKY